MKESWMSVSAIAKTVDITMFKKTAPCENNQYGVLRNYVGIPKEI